MVVLMMVLVVVLMVVRKSPTMGPATAACAVRRAEASLLIP